MEWGLGWDAAAAIAAACVGFAWCLGATWPGLRRLRRSAHAHWSERARLVHPYRGTAGAVASSLPAVLALAFHLAAHPGPVAIVAVALATSAGAVLGSFPLSRAIDPALGWDRWPVALQFWRHPMLIFWGMAVAMPGTMGPAAWGLALLTIAWIGAVQLHPVRLGMRGARVVPAPPALVAQAQALAREAQAPFRAIHVAREGLPNAFALPVSSELVLHERLLQELAPAELDAILRHEIDHLREPAWMTVGRIVAGNAHLALLFTKPAALAWGHVGIGPLFLAWILVPLAFNRLARRHEVLADVHGAGADPTAFANALLKLHQAALLPAVIESATTHPHLYDRLLACGITPDFPRPKPANVLTLAGALTSGALGAMIIITLQQWTRARHG